MKVLLSIKPEYVERIFSGAKKYEFRRKIFKREVSAVVVYATLPVGRVYGEFSLERIIEGSPSAIWKKCGRCAGIDRESFFAYFSGCEKAYALVVGGCVEYRKKQPIESLYNRRPPQSYMYVEE